jgi:hypothetical protein
MNSLDQHQGDEPGILALILALCCRCMTGGPLLCIAYALMPIYKGDWADYMPGLNQSGFLCKGGTSFEFGGIQILLNSF